MLVHAFAFQRSRGAADGVSEDELVILHHHRVRVVQRAHGGAAQQNGPALLLCQLDEALGLLLTPGVGEHRHLLGAPALDGRLGGNGQFFHLVHPAFAALVAVISRQLLGHLPQRRVLVHEVGRQHMDEPGAVHFGVVGADAPVTEDFRCRAVRLYDVGQQRQQGFLVVARRSTQVQHQTAAAIQHGPVGFHEGFQRFGVVHAAGVQQQCAAGQLPQRRGGVGVHRIPGQLQHFFGAVGVAHRDVPGQLQVAVPLLPLRLVSGQQGVGQVLHDALRRGAVDGQHFVTWAQARFLRHSIHEHARSAPAHRKAPGEGHIALGVQFKFQVAVSHPGAVLAHGLQHQQ